MFFSFLALITAFPFDVPKYSLILLYSSSNNPCSTLIESLDSQKDNNRAMCDKATPESDFDVYFLCQALYQYQDLFCSNSLTSFSDYISRVSPQSELLFIYSELTNDYTIDLRNIPSKIDVEITCGLPSQNLKTLEDSNLTSHRILSSIQKLTNNQIPLPFQSSNLKNPKADLKLSLVGDIRNQVSSLFISTNFPVFEITQTDLTIDSFSLVYNNNYGTNYPNLKVSPNTLNIRTKKLCLCPVFHSAFSESIITDLVSVDNYILYLPEEFEELISHCQIGFNTNQWELQFKVKGETQWKSIFLNDDKTLHAANYISYDKAKFFGIFSSLTAFDIKIISPNLPSGKGANVRFLNEIPSDLYYIYLTTETDLLKFNFPTQITIENSGEWSSTNNLPKIYLTSFPEKTKTIISHELESLNVVKSGEPGSPDQGDSGDPVPPDDGESEEIKDLRGKISKIPNFALFFDATGVPQEEIDEMRSLINEIKSCSTVDKIQDLTQTQRNQLKEVCLSMFSPFQGVFFSNGNNVNDVIAQVPSTTQLLLMHNSFNPTIDFNKFQAPVSVICFDLYDYFGMSSSKQLSIRNSFTKLIKTAIESSLDGTPESYGKFANNLKKGHKEEPTLGYIKIIGSMNTKVSYLCLFQTEVTFVDSPCDAQNLHLHHFIISADSEKIKSDFLYLGDIYYYTSTNLAQKIDQVNQITFIQQNESPFKEITLEYQNDLLSLQEGSVSSYQFPYSLLTKSIGFILNYDYSKIRKLTVNIKYTSTQDIKNIWNLNLSFGNNINFGLYGAEEFLQQLLPSEKAKGGRVLALPIIEFVYSNTWDSVAKTKRPELTVVSDDSRLDVDTSKIDRELTITKEAPVVMARKGGDDDDGGLSAGAIAGIVIACVVVVAAVVAVVVYFLVIRKKRDSSHEAEV